MEVFHKQLIGETSKNVKSLEVLWPVPKKFEILNIKSIGYSDHVIFPLKINLINILKNTHLNFRINYLVCKDICIPGNANIDLNIPAGEGKLTKHSFILEKTLSSIPSESLSLNNIKIVKTKIFTNKDLINFEILIEKDNSFKNPLIFLHTEYGLPVIKPKIELNTNLNILNAKFTFDKKLIKQKKIITEFIISDDKQNFYVKKDILVQNKISIIKNEYLIILFIALLGGLILNFMPCVLPVLSIKVLSLLNHLEDERAVRKSFILTTFGIISSFILLAIIFILLKYLGLSIGWGFQFQQPVFLMAVSLILFLFCLNLFGFFEISIPSTFNNKIIFGSKNKTYFKDFFNGFFATLMATPCSAPFVGTAITFAFTQSNWMMINIFIFMSLGMSSPYILLSLFPKFLYILPKPGRWMIYLKYILGLLLLATLIWVCNILLNHFNYYFIIASIFLIILTLLINYLINYKKITLIFSIFIFFLLPNFLIFESDYKKTNTEWLDFNSVYISELISENNIVFVDITADWCATCQYNKINVLNSQAIKEIFTKFNVIKVQGDWTKPNSKIQKFLQDYNKFGIPFNIMYNKNNLDGVILPELLSKTDLIQKLHDL